MKAIKIHMMHESGISFMDIAKQFGITAKEASQLWISVEKAKEKAKNKVKVVYRKRMTTSTAHHKLLLTKMRTL